MVRRGGERERQRRTKQRRLYWVKEKVTTRMDGNTVLRWTVLLRLNGM